MLPSEKFIIIMLKNNFIKYFNLIWLFYRIRNEILTPRTRLGKIVFLTLKKFIYIKKNIISEHFIAIYDLNINPITFNFIEFLILCNYKKNNQKYTGYKIYFIKKNFKSKEYKYLHDKIYSSKISKDSQSWRFNNIILPLLECVGDNCLEYRVLKSDKDLFHSLKGLDTYPENYNKYNKPLPDITFIYKQIKTLKNIGLSAPAQGKFYVNQFLKNHNLEKKSIITVTIRYQDYDNVRNSNLNEWLSFCEYVESTGYKIVVIPDTDNSWYIKNFFSKFLVFNEASFNLGLKIALYESSKMNYFPACGSADLCTFNENTNYIIFGFGPIEGSLVNKDHEFTYHNKNSNFLFAKKDGQIVKWENDSFDNLKKSFNQQVLEK